MEPRTGWWYLAHRYTTKNNKGDFVFQGEEANYQLVNVIAAKLIELGWRIYSPLSHTHPIHCAWPPFVGGEAHEMWYEFDNDFILTMPFRGIILCPGWHLSSGCRGEKELFESLGREVLYLHEGCVISKEG